MARTVFAMLRSCFVYADEAGFNIIIRQLTFEQLNVPINLLPLSDKSTNKTKIERNKFQISSLRCQSFPRTIREKIGRHLLQAQGLSRDYKHFQFRHSISSSTDPPIHPLACSYSMGLLTKTVWDHSNGYNNSNGSSNWTNRMVDHNGHWKEWDITWMSNMFCYRCKSGSALPRLAVPGRVDASANMFRLFVCRMWSCHFHILFIKQTICNSHVLVVCISDDGGQSLHIFPQP